MNLIEIAKKLKLAPSTISRALNPATEHLISEKTRKKVVKFARAVHFVPNQSARELVTGRSQAIGLILSTVFEGLFYSENLSRILSGIYQVLEENSFLENSNQKTV